MSAVLTGPVTMPIGLLWQEIRALAKARRTKLVMAAVAYTVLVFPFLMRNPPAQMVAFAGQWFGSADGAEKLFLFGYTDLAMNKMAVFAGIVLAGGIIADQRARGELPLFWSKPVTRAQYFLTKLVAATLLFGAIYAAATAVGALYYPTQITGLRVGPFLALSAAHMFAAMFAVTFAGTMAVVVGRKVGAMILSTAVLGAGIGTAFVSFYEPSFRLASLLNPFYHGVELVGRLDSFGPMDILVPIVILLAFNVAVAALGAWRISRTSE